MSEEETEKEINELAFKYFKLGWDLAKHISYHEGFVFGASDNRCIKEFQKILTKREVKP